MTTQRHNDGHDSTHTVRTDYGVFYVCEGCLNSGHMPAREGSEPKRHPVHDTRGCECEHIDHADNPLTK